MQICSTRNHYVALTHASSSRSALSKWLQKEVVLPRTLEPFKVRFGTKSVNIQSHTSSAERIFRSRHTRLQARLQHFQPMTRNRPEPAHINIEPKPSQALQRDCLKMPCTAAQLDTKCSCVMTRLDATHQLALIPWRQIARACCCFSCLCQSRPAGRRFHSGITRQQPATSSR
jgi:hypothetical protein